VEIDVDVFLHPGFAASSSFFLRGNYTAASIFGSPYSTWDRPADYGSEVLVVSKIPPASGALSRSFSQRGKSPKCPLVFLSELSLRSRLRPGQSSRFRPSSNLPPGSDICGHLSPPPPPPPTAAALTRVSHGLPLLVAR